LRLWHYPQESLPCRIQLNITVSVRDVLFSGRPTLPRARYTADELRAPALALVREHLDADTHSADEVLDLPAQLAQGDYRGSLAAK
jgi:hypothetical protein